MDLQLQRTMMDGEEEEGMINQIRMMVGELMMLRRPSLPDREVVVEVVEVEKVGVEEGVEEELISLVEEVEIREVVSR
jgi:hypothetical protein